MDDYLIKRATTRAHQDVVNINKETQFRKDLPKPRTITQVSEERRIEKELELIAPKTGYPDLDKIVRGFVPGHLYTLTGNENVGKTSLACNFAVRVAKQGKKVLYFALEPENMVVDYIASVRFDKRFEDLTQEETEFDDGNIHIFGKEEISTINDLVEIVEHTDRYDLLIIDHIGYFVTGENTNWVQEQSNAIKRLIGLAKNKKTAIMIIAHLRKPASGSKKTYIPSSNDISGSAAFKQDSTEVMIVTRNLVDPDSGGMEYSKDGTLFVTKTKAGPNGLVQLTFSERKANIVSWGETLEKQRKKITEEGYVLEKPIDKW